MSDIKELARYEIEGKVQDELKKEMDESFEIPEVKKDEKTEVSTNKDKLLPEAIKRTIAYALLEEHPMGMGMGMGHGPYDPDRYLDPKIAKIAKLLRKAEEIVYRLRDSANDQDDDLGIDKMLSSKYESILGIIINKISKVWAEAPKKEKKDDEVKPEINGMVIAQAETIESPQGISYKVLDVNSEEVTLEEISTGKKAIVKTEIASNWKNKE